MKLAPRDAAAFLNRPDPRCPALLIYGEDPMRVADKRVKVVLSQVGPQGDAEMRLTRINGADLRRDPALLGAEIKAQGFFPGPRAVLVDDAGDAATPALANALADWAPGDALIVVTAGALATGSKLRKLFEGDKRALVLAVYDDPPTRAEIEEMLRAEGLTALPPESLRDLGALAQVLEPGDFRQTLTRIALFKLGDSSPLTPAEIADLAPQSTEAELDDALAALAEGRVADLPPLLSKLAAQGVQPVTVFIGATRHFRTLHALVSAPGGPAQGVERLRPPVYGPRREALMRQAQLWRLDKVEEALRDLTATDLMLRSSTRAPVRALAERALIRLARLAGRR